jgi:hypothetical protein
MLSRRNSRAALAASLLALTYAGAASANPRPLPFTYPNEQLVTGATELEQFIDFTTAKASDVTSGKDVPYGQFQFQTEFEHGITDRLELGLYVMYAPSTPTDFAPNSTPRPLEGNGMKQRLRFKLADTGVWPIDVAVYGELVESEREVEIEGKLILQRRLGIARIMANVTGEQEFYYNGEKEFVFDPSAGVTFEATPAIQPGIEWWMRAEFSEEGENEKNAPGSQQYVGPALMLQMGSLWWTNGFYMRVSNWNDNINPPHQGFGKLWIRSVIGFGF